MEPRQLSLFEAALPAIREPAQARAEDLLATLRERLAGHLDRHALGRLTLTDNRSTILSGRPADDGRLAVRLHWSFFDAPPPVLAAAARIVDGAGGAELRRSRARVRDWVAERRGEEPPAGLEVHIAPGRGRSAPPTVDPQGHVHDLEAIRDEVNRRYFGGRHAVAIGWSRPGRLGGSPRGRRRARRRTIKLGSWSADDRTVRIHPVLDHASVPRWVVASVVHHELLHADIDPVTTNGRRRLHTPEFRRREREFEHHDDARRWIDRHLSALLRRRDRLRP